MKIALVNAPPRKIMGDVGYLYPPLGILYVASYIRKHLPDIKLKLKVIDGYQEGFKKTVEMIKRFDPDIVGLSFTTQAATGAYEIAKEIKEIDNLVVAGGPHVTASPEEALMRSPIDIVVIGEGEITFLELIRSFMESFEPRKIDGICFKRDGKIIRTKPRGLIQNINEIPFPARDLIDIKKYPGYYVKKRKPETSYISSRGCPFNCTFCSNPVWKISKPWIRLRSPKNIADEVEFLTKKEKIREFFDQCDEFNPNSKWSIEVCKELINRKLDVAWKTQIRVDKVNEEFAKYLAKSGCWLVFLGIESGNQKTLEGIRKRISLEQAVKACETLKKYGIKTFGLFMAFNVWEEDGELRYENYEDSLNTLRFAKKLLDRKLLDFFSWSLTTPYPGSRLFDICTKYGLIDEGLIDSWEKLDSSSNFVIKLPDVDERMWLDLRNKGALLQAKCVLESGNLSLSALSLYVKRAKQIFRRFIKGHLSV
jgi:radical SAM superfamily enzyme YgiQ (UPF0313 family)